ncbi:DNA (cytosine-5-)-methyltransferase [Clostridium botulinum]|uniref:DNA (cytosine-5-)-methyltransferase n=1 Tax=Clostridium botulinum TaxID=1491 RepID=UPI001967EB7F|nr:DNA (cytosine-5-)-methyltransferase [Clostridium botulinum]
MEFIDFIEIYKDHIRVREATKKGYAIGVDGDSINFEQPNSKTRRGRIGHQIAQTLTCSCNQGVIINMNEILVVGNTVPSNHTSGRIFNVEGVSPTVMYRNSKVVQILENKIKNNKGDSNMREFTNNLTKYNFNMEEIKIFDSFAGIGAMHNSLKYLGVPTKIIGLSETDIDATISYAGVHIDNFIKLEFEYPSEDEMREWLMNRNIGWDFQKQKSSIPRLKKDKLYKVYKASVLLNNLGDISQLDYSKIENFDLFNFSFPCTDISGAGKQKGLKNEDGTPTRSGLVKYGIELIKTKKPKYIMIENVKALIQKKFINDFYDIINEIESYGYKCYYPKKENGQPTCLNAKDYGIAQNRERIFVICVRNDIDNGLFEFPKGFDSGLRLKDFLQNTVEDKYFLSEEIQNRFKLNGNEDENRNELNILGSSIGEKCTRLGTRDMTYGVNGIMSTLSATDYKQPKQILNTNQPNLIGGIGEINFGKQFRQGNRVYDKNSIAMCLMSQPVGNTGGFSYLYGEKINTNDIIKIGDIPKEVLNDNERQRRVYSNEGVSPTILSRTDNAKIVDEKYYLNKPWHFSTENDEKHDTNEIAQIEGINYKATRSICDPNMYCRTLDTMGGGQREPKTIELNNDTKTKENLQSNFRIRKLTPNECWRLMGFTDEQFDRAKELGISDSQLYKQAGNSIVVNVLYYIFKELFKEYIIE